jgi:cytochrome c-type biogenesis protein CcmH/NrfF
MRTPTWFIWLIIIAAIVVGGTLWWKQLPSHKQEFYKNFARQIKYLPARYVA